MYKNYLKLLCLVVLVLGISSKIYAYDNHDFQIWNTDVEEMKINKKFKAVFEEEFRWGDNASEYYYEHFDVGILYEINKYFNAGLGYRYIKELQNKSWGVENDPYLVINLSGELKGFKFDSRNRFEYRTYNYNKVDSGRYRNKITIRFPWKFTKLEIQPFVSDEIFIRFNGTDFNQNRFSAGIGLPVTKNLKAEIFYMLQCTKNYKSTGSTWTDTNVLGTKLKYVF